MFAQQSRAQFAPMNMPPGSPRQSGGGFGGKGGGGSSQVSTPGGGGKGGGGRPMQGRAFDNNFGNNLMPQQGSSMFGAAQNMSGGPALNQYGLPMGTHPSQVASPSTGGDPASGFLAMMGNASNDLKNNLYGAGPSLAGPIQTQTIGAPSQPPVLNEYGLPAAVQPPALNQYGLPYGTHPSQVASQSTGGAPPALNQYGLPMGTHPSQVASPSTGTGPAAPQPPMNPFLQAGQGGIPNMQGLMAQLQGFGGF